MPVHTQEQEATAKLMIEAALREMMSSTVFKASDSVNRQGALIHYLGGRFSLDPLLLARFLGDPIFTQQFEGQEPKEERQPLLMAANREDDEVCKFLLYAKVGDELTTGGGAAPACTLRRVA